MPYAPEPFLEFGPYHIATRHDYDDEMVRIFDETLWGTEETVYQHFDTASRLKNIDDFTVYAGRTGEETMCLVMYINRLLALGDKTVRAEYARYLASVMKYRGHPVVARCAMLTMSRIMKIETRPTVYYACIESRNKRSFNLVSRLGYKKVATVKTIGFSRFFPKKSADVMCCQSDSEIGEIRPLLQQAYGGYSLYHEHHIFQENDYYYIKKDGEIVAGAQVHRAHWQVHQLPGKSGKFFMKVTPHIPFINRIFNPNAYRFITVEGIICRPGHVKAFQRLLEHLLVLCRVNTALIWMDASCPIYTRLNQELSKGLIHQFVKDTDTYIMACGKNLSEEDNAELKSSTKYVCTYDFI